MSVSSLFCRLSPRLRSAARVAINTRRRTVRSQTLACYSRRFLAGKSVPSEAEVFVSGTEGKPELVKAVDLFRGKRVALFSIPGAFTSTCTEIHFPGYLKNAQNIKAKGKIDMVACIAKNDPFVMSALADQSRDINKDIVLISDTSASNGLTDLLGKTIDLSVVGLGVRSLRFSAVIDNNKFIFYAEESDPSEVSVSSADELLENV